MGGFLHTAGQMDNIIKSDLDEITLKEIQDIQKLYMKQHHNQELMNDDLFSDVFMEVLGDCAYIHDKLKREEDGLVNYFEVIAILLIFCKSRLHEKIHGVFELFDFDQSGDIVYMELLSTLECCMHGMCRICGIPPPNKREMHHLSLKAFADIDTDKTQKIDKDEFTHWIEKDEEIQDFMAHYNNYQTLEHSLKVYDKQFLALMKCFKTSCEAGHTLNMQTYKHLTWFEKIKLHEEFSCPLESIMGKLGSATGFSRRDMKTVTSMLQKRAPNGRVFLDFYSGLARAVASFLAVDIDGNKKIEGKEINALFWLVEGEELSPARIKKEMELCDANKKGEIGLDEWVNYMAMTDPVTGQPSFDFELKKKFAKFDEDGSGTLEIEELTLMLKETFQEHLTKAPEAKKKEANQMVEALAKDMMKTMDKDGNNNLDWGEFKGYFALGGEKENKLAEYMKVNF